MNYNLYTRIHKNFSYTIKLAKNGIGIKEIINEDVHWSINTIFYDKYCEKLRTHLKREEKDSKWVSYKHPDVQIQDSKYTKLSNSIQMISSAKIHIKFCGSWKDVYIPIMFGGAGIGRRVLSLSKVAYCSQGEDSI